MSTDAVKSINGSLKGIVIKTDFPKVNGEDIDPTYKTIKMYDVPKGLHKFMYETIYTGKSAYYNVIPSKVYGGNVETYTEEFAPYLKHRIYSFPRIGFLQDEGI